MLDQKSEGPGSPPPAAAPPSNRRPQLELISPNASPEEAAAIMAALERFMRDTAPRRVPAPSPPDPWRRAALHEGVQREVEPVDMENT
jgi:hypothetical protein